MDRLERLVNLVAALIDAPRPLTREELRIRVGGYADDDDAFRRNFERDKDTLRQMGLPLVTAPLEADRPDEAVGYRIPREDYELPDPGLSEEELTALRIAASAVRLDGVLGDAGATSALRKLAALPPGGGEGSGTPPGGGEGSGTPPGGGEGSGTPPEGWQVPAAELAGGEAVTTAFGAIAERRRVRFRYRGEPRVVEPWHLSFRGGTWYLSGRDTGREAERLFRLDRVEGRLQTDGEAGAFAPPAAGPSSPPPPWRLGEEAETAVTVLVDAEQVRWARQAVAAGAAAVERPDGGLELTLQVTNRSAFRSWLLGFLDHAEVLAPPELRTEVVGWLEAIAAGNRA